MPTTSLPKDIFNVDVNNHQAIKLAYDSYLAEQRNAHARTLRRGEVSGGGRKPWKQKGTGRARVGSIRSPIWRGGGITFGPIGNQNFTKQINKKTKQLALKQSLSMANDAGIIQVVDFTVSTGKTKEAADFLVKNKLSQDRLVIVVDAKTPEMIRATNNLSGVKLISSRFLNVFAVVNAKAIIMSPAAIESLQTRLSTKIDGGDK